MKVSKEEFAKRKAELLRCNWENVKKHPEIIKKLEEDYKFNVEKLGCILVDRQKLRSKVKDGGEWCLSPMCVNAVKEILGE